MKDWLVQNTRIEWYYQTLRKENVCDEWGNFIFGRPVSSHDRCFGRVFKCAADDKCTGKLSRGLSFIGYWARSWRSILYPEMPENLNIARMTRCQGWMMSRHLTCPSST